MHPTYRSLNKVPEICGCERRLFICAIVMGPGLALVMNSWVLGAVLFLGFAVLGYARAKDPIMLRLMFNASRYKAVYCPALKSPFMVRYLPLLCIAVFSAVAAPAPKPVPVPIIAQEPQAARTIQYSDRDVIPLTTRVRFTTMVVLPKEEQIVDILSGDKDNWVANAAQNFAFIKPAVADSTTNLNLITESGNVYSFILNESSKIQTDLKVFIEPRGAGLLSSISGKARFVPAVAVEDYKAQLDRAREQTLKAQEDAQKQIEQIERKARTETLMAKAALPQQMKFEYFYKPQEDFNVTAIWHDGKFTYIAANPTETPTLYELKDKSPSLIQFQYANGLYTVNKKLDRFYLAIGRRKLHVTRQEK